MKTVFKRSDELVFQIYSATVKGTYVRETEDDITIKVTQDFSGGIGRYRTIDKVFLITAK